MTAMPPAADDGSAVHTVALASNALSSAPGLSKSKEDSSMHMPMVAATAVVVRTSMPTSTRR